MPRERGGGETSWISNSPGCRAFRRRPALPPRPLVCGRRLSPSPLLPPLLLPARPLSCSRGNDWMRFAASAGCQWGTNISGESRVGGASAAAPAKAAEVTADRTVCPVGSLCSPLQPHGAWRSLVQHSAGGRAGSRWRPARCPATPSALRCDRCCEKSKQEAARAAGSGRSQPSLYKRAGRAPM